MDNFDRTIRVTDDFYQTGITGSMLVTVFDGNTTTGDDSAGWIPENPVTFGRSKANDLVLDSPLVSREHGRFRFQNGQWRIEDKALYGAEPSANGLLYNGGTIRSRVLCAGDFIRIDDGVETIADGVLLVFSSSESENQWKVQPLGGKRELTVGRGTDCDIVLPHISVSKHHQGSAREKDGILFPTAEAPMVLL